MQFLAMIQFSVLGAAITAAPVLSPVLFSGFGSCLSLWHPSWYKWREVLHFTCVFTAAVLKATPVSL